MSLIEQQTKQAREEFYQGYTGKPEKHPVPCEDCGSDFWVDWCLPHPVFNAVCPGGNGYLCLPCFTKRLEAQERRKAGQANEYDTPRKT